MAENDNQSPKTQKKSWLTYVVMAILLIVIASNIYYWGFYKNNETAKKDQIPTEVKKPVKRHHKKPVIQKSDQILNAIADLKSDVSIGFQKVDERFNQVDERINNLEETVIAGDDKIIEEVSKVGIKIDDTNKNLKDILGEIKVTNKVLASIKIKKHRDRPATVDGWVE